MAEMIGASSQLYHFHIIHFMTSNKVHQVFFHISIIFRYESYIFSQQTQSRLIHLDDQHPSITHHSGPFGTTSGRFRVGLGKPLLVPLSSGDVDRIPSDRKTARRLWPGRVETTPWWSSWYSPVINDPIGTLYCTYIYIYMCKNVYVCNLYIYN